MEKLAIVILAAGHGMRMMSRKQKVLHEVGGKPMVEHVYDTARAVTPHKPVLIVGAGEQGVRRLLGNRADYSEQAERLGTGHATRMAASCLQDKVEQVVVMYGDMPLLRSETILRLARRQARTDAAIVMLSVLGDTTSPFGRVIRDDQGQVVDIMEVAEAKRQPNAAELLAVRELNVGVYCFDAPWLWANLHHLPQRQARSGPEYYLTDMVSLAVRQSREVRALPTDEPDECLGAGTRAELVLVEKAFRRRANRKWLAAGVTLIDPEATYIDQDVSIGRDTVIWPNTYVQGASLVGENCTLGPNTIIRNARIGSGCQIEQAMVSGMTLEANTVVPPFSVVRETKGEHGD